MPIFGEWPAVVVRCDAGQSANSGTLVKENRRLRTAAACAIRSLEFDLPFAAYDCLHLALDFERFWEGKPNEDADSAPFN